MAQPLDTDVAIETPEHIVFRHRVAGPARRALAYVVDLIVCYVSLLIVTVVILLAAAGAASLGVAVDAAGASIGIFLVLLFLAQWAYFVVFEGWRGTTPGKAATGLRVVTTTGRPIGFGPAVLRNLLRAADALPTGYLVGFTAMVLSPRFQRLGDLIAGTMVIVTERTTKAAPVVLWPPAQPFELAVLPEEVALDPDERHAIELFLRRRGRLGPARENELASIVVLPLAKRFGYPVAARVTEPARTLALLYDRAANAGRSEVPPSSRGPVSWR